MLSLLLFLFGKGAVSFYSASHFVSRAFNVHLYLRKLLFQPEILISVSLLFRIATKLLAMTIPSE
jgi:hypothetical protein